MYLVRERNGILRLEVAVKGAEPVSGGQPEASGDRIVGQAGFGGGDFPVRPDDAEAVPVEDGQAVVVEERHPVPGQGSQVRQRIHQLGREEKPVERPVLPVSAQVILAAEPDGPVVLDEEIVDVLVQDDARHRVAVIGGEAPERGVI